MRKTIFVLAVFLLSAGVAFSGEVSNKTKDNSREKTTAERVNIASEIIDKVDTNLSLKDIVGKKAIPFPTGINSNHSMYRNTLKRTGAYIQESAPGNTVKWTLELEHYSANLSPSMMVIKDNILYCTELVSEYGEPPNTYSTYRVFGIDIDTGGLVWEYYLPSLDYRVDGPLCAAGDFLYLPTAQGLFALDINTGEEKWFFYSGYNFGINLAPIVYNNIVYFGDQHGLKAIDAQTGSLIWQFGVYYYEFYSSAPAIDPNTKSIFFAAIANEGGGKVWSLDLDTGNIKWEYSLRGVCSIPLAVFGDKVFVQDFYNPGQYNIDHIALDKNSGELIWSYHVYQYDNQYAPYVINAEENLIYVNDLVPVSGWGRTTALNIDTGESLWSFQDESAFRNPVLINNYLFLPCLNSELGIKVIDAITGDFVREYRQNGYRSVKEAIPADNKLFAYYVSDDINDPDLIVCYE